MVSVHDVIIINTIVVFIIAVDGSRMFVVERLRVFLLVRHACGLTLTWFMGGPEFGVGQQMNGQRGNRLDSQPAVGTNERPALRRLLLLCLMMFSITPVLSLRMRLQLFSPKSTSQSTHSDSAQR